MRSYAGWRREIRIMQESPTGYIADDDPLVLSRILEFVVGPEVDDVGHEQTLHCTAMLPDDMEALERDEYALRGWWREVANRRFCVTVVPEITSLRDTSRGLWEITVEGMGRPVR